MPLSFKKSIAIKNLYIFLSVVIVIFELKLKKGVFMRKTFVFFLLFCVAMSYQIAAEDFQNVEQCHHLSMRKVYVDYQNLNFTEGGIFLIDESGQCVRISMIFHDEEGYYLLNPAAYCPGGHFLCFNCYPDGCCVNGCPYQCACSR